MPWHTARSSSCPASKPWAVIKDSDGSIEGCHSSQEKANRQLSALYASENSVGAFHLPGKHDQSSHGNGSTGIGEWIDGELVEGERAGGGAAGGDLDVAEARSTALAHRKEAMKRYQDLVEEGFSEDLTEEEWMERALAERNYEQYFLQWEFVNSALREGRPGADVESMDKAFEFFGSRTEGKVVVHRGVDARHPDLSKMRTPGARLGEAGYLSTSANRDIPKEYSTSGPSGEGAVMAIEVPPGTRFLPGISRTELEELVFERGSQLEVLEPYPDGTLHMRLIPPERGGSGGD